MNLINGKSSHTIILANKTCMFCTVSKACFIYDSVISLKKKLKQASIIQATNEVKTWLNLYGEIDA